MRLTTEEIETIKLLPKENFGENIEVLLFGSRVDDKQKGGDIDLLVKLNEPVNSHWRSVSNIYWTQLQEKLEEQKFDILLASPESDTQIIKIAQETGVLL